MICPQCHDDTLRVIDSRDVAAEPAIRRRRECESCSYRFTTYERVEAAPLWVIKKDSTREAFDRAKLARGIWRSCEKRPVSEAAIEQVVSDIEADLRNAHDGEVGVRAIGDTAMGHLRDFDHIAYIRFACVYRDFTDLADLEREVVQLRAAAQSRRHSVPPSLS